MYICGKITVKPQIPDNISRLEELANNLWWSWNIDALKLFKIPDPELWLESDCNPVKLLYNIGQKKLVEASKNPDFLKRYDEIMTAFDAYMNPAKTWYTSKYPDKKENIIAYFSAEYGLDEILPIYSGGLGILSGDHMKTASDLGLPFVGVGLFYRQGYFNQLINNQGWQETTITNNNINYLPIKPALDKNGNEVTISIDLPNRPVYAKVWQINIGRIKLYLLDTFVDQNNDSDKLLTARLYGGDQEMRIIQEILLGIGGIKALEALGIKPTIYHMNEGHTSFVGIELARKLVQEKGIPFNIAKEVVMGSCIFTTHTPVPAGHDVFPLQFMDKYFSNYYGYLGISREEFLSLGMQQDFRDTGLFNMTILGIKMSGKRNGVSELHGEVMRNMQANIWPSIPENEVPIGAITNGVHTFSWLGNDLSHLFDKYFPKNWKENIYKQEIWDKVLTIPDEEIWALHIKQKEQLLTTMRERLADQKSRHGMSINQLHEINTYFKPDVLTIGFARRFATYKRANLIFRDIDRLANIVNNSNRPVQIIFAGKAHPADKPGQELIREIYQYTNDPKFKGKIVFLENYNMNMARYLVHGADVWLNNPRRPLEASGTSGQKASVNGVVNFSILDGWWVEGYNGENGWSIGEDRYYDNYEQQDNFDSESLYSTLENKIAPLYYERDEKGIPVGWVKMLKESIRSTGYRFSTHRMLQDYVAFAYAPLIDKTLQIVNSNYELAKLFVDWKQYITENWNQISLTPVNDSANNIDLKFNHMVNVSVNVYLGTVDPGNVSVEVYYGKTDANDRIENPTIKEITEYEKTGDHNYIYHTDIDFDDSGNYAYTFRVMPKHSYLMNKQEMALIKWVNN